MYLSQVNAVNIDEYIFLFHEHLSPGVDSVTLAQRIPWTESYDKRRSLTRTHSKGESNKIVYLTGPGNSGGLWW